jgi:hypothetical protein
MKRDLCGAVFIGIVILLLVQATEAQEAEYGLLWSYQTGSLVSDSSISSDGSYIAAISESDVYFFNREGKLLWSYAIGGSQTKGVIRVSVSSDGAYIAAVVNDGNIYFFNREGGLLWKNYTSGKSVDGVSVSSDGAYIAAVYDGDIYFFNREGKYLWSYNPFYPGTSYISDVSVSSDGTYIAAGSYDKVYFLNREGKLLWDYTAGNYTAGKHVDYVSVSPDGLHIAIGIAANSRDDYVYLLNREGKFLWSYNIPKESVILVSYDGAYIVAGSYDTVYLLNKDGKFLWSVPSPWRLPIPVVGGFSVSSNGTYIAFGSEESVYFFGDTKREATAGMLRIKWIITSEKSKGFNVAAAESLFFRSEQVFKAGDYSTAKNLAEQAKANALDIDSDGVLNETDFAPTVNNNYIYSGVAILFVGSVIALRRHQHLANERKRKERERESNERMKREILDKIEDVVGKDEK